MMGAAVSTPMKWHDAEDMLWAVRRWAARIGVKSPQVHLREMRRKWASVSTAGRLTLNLELLGLPRELGEFVIVHELVHLLAPNHGKVFKSFMHAYLPGWPGLERQLHTHARSSNEKAHDGTKPSGRVLKGDCGV